MEIVPPNIVQVGDANIDASVIQRAEEPSDDDVEKSEEGVRLVSKCLVAELCDPEERPQVIVFSNDVLDWVSVDGVDVASPRSVLHVMMLVDVRIEPLEVKEAVEEAVEKVVEDDDAREKDGEDAEVLDRAADCGGPRGRREDEIFHTVKRIIAGEKDEMIQEHDRHNSVELNHGLVGEGENCVAASLVGKDAMTDCPVGERDKNIIEETKTDIDDDGEENILREILEC